MIALVRPVGDAEQDHVPLVTLHRLQVLHEDRFERGLAGKGPFEFRVLSASRIEKVLDQ